MSFTYQLYEGMLDPMPTVKCRRVRPGSYSPASSSCSSSSSCPLSPSLSPADFFASDGNRNCALKSPHRYTTIELHSCVRYGRRSWAREYDLPALPTGPACMIWLIDRDAATGGVDAPAEEATEPGGGGGGGEVGELEGVGEDLDGALSFAGSGEESFGGSEELFRCCRPRSGDLVVVVVVGRLVRWKESLA